MKSSCRDFDLLYISIIKYYIMGIYVIDAYNKIHLYDWKFVEKFKTYYILHIIPNMKLSTKSV